MFRGRQDWSEGLVAEPVADIIHITCHGLGLGLDVWTCFETGFLAGTWDAATTATEAYNVLREQLWEIQKTRGPQRT